MDELKKLEFICLSDGWGDADCKNLDILSELKNLEIIIINYNSDIKYSNFLSELNFNKIKLKLEPFKIISRTVNPAFHYINDNENITELDLSDFRLQDKEYYQKRYFKRKSLKIIW